MAQRVEKKTIFTILFAALFVLCAASAILLSTSVQTTYAEEQSGSVASMGVQEYTSLQDAIDAYDASEDDTIIVLTDITPGSYLEVNKSVTIDLNGHTISRTGNVFDISNTADTGITVTIKNGSIESAIFNAVLVTDNVELVIDNVNIYGNEYGIRINSIIQSQLSTYSSTVKVTNSKIEGGSYGVGVYGSTGEGVTTFIVEDTEITGGTYGIVINSSDALAVYPSKVIVDESEIYGGTAGVTIFGISTESSSGKDATTFIANDTTITGGTYGVIGNGSSSLAETYIELINCTVTSERYWAIYHPQHGTMIIEDSIITGGQTGIEIRAGIVTIINSTVTGSTEEFGTYANPSGTSVSGAAVAISQHSTDWQIEVTIIGGTYTGYYAVYEEDLMNESATEDIAISITDGIFEGGVASENVTGFISGGTFSTAVAEEYIADGTLVLYDEAGAYTVMTEKEVELFVAQTDALSDIRNYAATKGIDWSVIQSAAEDDTAVGYDFATLVLEYYNSISEADNRYAVSSAKLAAIEAIDGFAAAVEEASLNNESEATDLTAIYILLGITLVLLIVACVLIIVIYDGRPFYRTDRKGR